MRLAPAGRSTPSGKRAAVLLAYCLTGAACSPAWGAAPPAAAPSAVPSTSTPAVQTGGLPQGVETAVAPAVVARVQGFRSARFGMTEDEVRAAINTDFPQTGSAIQSSSNAVEQTKIIAIKVPDLLPDSGTASVSYVFGHKTRKLIQVSVAWSKQLDPKTTPERLVVTGEMLKAGFVDQVYKSDSVVVDKPVKSGILMFRGQDAQEHTTLLLLQGTLSPEKGDAEKAQRTLVPNELLLLYIADVKSPDIFKIPAGKF